MTTIHDILAEFRASASNNRDLGDKCEPLIANYLVTEPQYQNQFSEVWMWSEWRGRGNQPTQLEQRRVDLDHLASDTVDELSGSHVEPSGPTPAAVQSLNLAMTFGVRIQGVWCLIVSAGQPGTSIDSTNRSISISNTPASSTTVTTHSPVVSRRTAVWISRVSSFNCKMKP